MCCVLSWDLWHLSAVIICFTPWLWCCLFQGQVRGCNVCARCDCTVCTAVLHWEFSLLSFLGMTCVCVCNFFFLVGICPCAYQLSGFQNRSAMAYCLWHIEPFYCKLTPTLKKTKEKACKHLCMEVSNRRRAHNQCIEFIDHNWCNQLKVSL